MQTAELGHSCWRSTARKTTETFGGKGTEAETRSRREVGTGEGGMIWCLNRPRATSPRGHLGCVERAVSTPPRSTSRHGTSVSTVRSVAPRARRNVRGPKHDERRRGLLPVAPAEQNLHDLRRAVGCGSHSHGLHGLLLREVLSSVCGAAAGEGQVI
jgi:hypothetical protein